VRRRTVPLVEAERDLVVETADGRYCGAVVGVGQALDAGERRDTVTLEDRHGRRRVLPMLPAAFLLEGQPVTLVRPSGEQPRKPRARTASGSFAVEGFRARVARGSRIWVEGVHDAALVERVWGADLRVEGVVVEPLSGIDHLVSGSKESRIVSAAQRPYVHVTGHPYVDVWQAVKPAALGIDRWPDVPPGVPWKDGVCAALRVREPREMWRRVLAGVDSYADIEVPMLRAVEELIDFVTA
jgi:hypothetical protein